MADDQVSEEAYRAEIAKDIKSVVDQMGCQPILFVGSGLSKRYFGGPNWDELLSFLAKECPLIDKPYAYYKQTLNNQLAVGQEFAKMYQQWAWDKGRNQFPAEMFSDNIPVQAYIKFVIAERIAKITPKDLGVISDENIAGEITALQNIKPHAIITTNYDKLLDMIFPEYQPVIGQNIIRDTPVLFGEIFKIHGCVSDPDSLIFTQQDYDHFMRKKKYLSAKLLTYFSEHPLLFVGYSAGDPNIRAILSDIDEAIPRPGPSGALIPNIYILEWRKDFPLGYRPAREKLIPVEDGRSVRIKAIESDNFNWVFLAFGSNSPLNAVSPKILRALLHRSYDLVRHDIPRKTVQADFEMLERAVKTGPEFAKLFGITTVSRASSNSADFPYTLSEVAEKIAGTNAYWYQAQLYLDKIKREKGIDIKSNDNKYHCATRVGRKKTSIVHKYSDHFLDLIDKLKKEADYELEL